MLNPAPLFRCTFYLFVRASIYVLIFQMVHNLIVKTKNFILPTMDLCIMGQVHELFCSRGSEKAYILAI